MTGDSINPKDALGVRKASLRFVPHALRILAVPAMVEGARKYGPMNWRTKRVKLSVYLEATDRHLAAYADGQNLDPESGASHLSHAVACLAIVADAAALGMLDDDRMTPGPAAVMLADLDTTAKGGQHTGDEGMSEATRDLIAAYTAKPLTRDDIADAFDVPHAWVQAAAGGDPDEQIGDDPAAGYDTTPEGFVRKVEHPLPVRRVVPNGRDFAPSMIDPKQDPAPLVIGQTVYTLRDNDCGAPGGMIGFVDDVEQGGTYVVSLPGMYGPLPGGKYRCSRHDLKAAG